MDAVAAAFGRRRAFTFGVCHLRGLWTTRRARRCESAGEAPRRRGDAAPPSPSAAAATRRAWRRPAPRRSTRSSGSGPPPPPLSWVRVLLRTDAAKSRAAARRVPRPRPALRGIVLLLGATRARRGRDLGASRDGARRGGGAFLPPRGGAPRRPPRRVARVDAANRRSKFPRGRDAPRFSSASSPRRRRAGGPRAGGAERVRVAPHRRRLGARGGGGRRVGQRGVVGVPRRVRAVRGNRRRALRRRRGGRARDPAQRRATRHAGGPGGSRAGRAGARVP